MLHFYSEKDILFPSNQSKNDSRIKRKQKTMQLFLHMPRCMPACLIDNTLVLLKQYYL